MTLGIMQPYFMPYIGYISLIKHVDKFVLLDCVQYIRHGWIERNRILKQAGGWQYIQVPVIKENGRSTLIMNTKINNGLEWKNKIFAQLQHYKKKAPYYYQVINLLKEIFSKNYENIVTLNEESLIKVCSYLGINTPIYVFSKMNLEIDSVHAPDEWALNICKAIPETTDYINPVGGESFFSPQKYDEEEIRLLFQHMEIQPYNQKIEGFEPALSIIDVLMFNSVEETNRLLDCYSFLPLCRQ